MRIIEIKSQHVTIQYKPTEEKIVVGDFLNFNEGNTTLVAQVLKIFSDNITGEYNKAELLLLLTQKYEKVFTWNGEIVSANADVTKTSVEFLENYINQGSFDDTFALGYCTEENTQPFKLTFKNFTTPAIVGYEKPTDNILFAQTLAHRFKFTKKKLLIIDYNGNMEIEGANRVIAGFQMKLPLNSETLEFLSSKMTLGISADAKAVIDEILIDLAKFAKETNNFISISKLINVIEDIYKKSKISQLILFKNKLRIFQRQNIFADTINETNYVYNTLMANNTVVFDISNIPPEWHNEFLSNALFSTENVLEDYYIYLPIEQGFDNKLLNYLLFKAVKNKIKPIVAANYRFVAMDSILDFCANSFLFSTKNALNKREYLSDILQSLPQNHFVTKGELTSSLAITSCLNDSIEALDMQFEYEQNTADNETIDIIQKNMEEHQSEEVQLPDVDMLSMNTAMNFSQDKPEIVELQSENINKENVLEQKEEIQETKIEQEIKPEIEPEVEQKIEPEVEQEIKPEIEQEIEPKVEQEVEPEIEQEIEPEVEQEVEPEVEQEIEPEVEQEVEPELQLQTELQSKQETKEEEEFTQISQTQEIQLLPLENNTLSLEDEISTNDEYIPDEDDKLVHKDVLDNSYNNEIQIEDIGLDDLDFLEEVQEEQPYTQNDEDELLDLLSETDDTQEIENMNIDELDFEDTNETNPQEDISQKLPVYDAQYQEKPKEDTSFLQEGDLVKHNKYGLGTVKKLINHGNKIMCFINFEDFGRRLLDPEISQLVKIK